MFEQSADWLVNHRPSEPTFIKRGPGRYTLPPSGS